MNERTTPHTQTMHTDRTPRAPRTTADAKRPVGAKLTVAVVALAILTFLGILSETSLNIAYSTLMEEFSIGASVVQWLTTGYLLPFSIGLGMITWTNFTAMAWTIPLVVVAVLCGRWVARRVSQSMLSMLVYALSVVAVVRLFL